MSTMAGLLASPFLFGGLPIRLRRTVAGGYLQESPVIRTQRVTAAGTAADLHRFPYLQLACVSNAGEATIVQGQR